MSLTSPEHTCLSAEHSLRLSSCWVFICSGLGGGKWGSNPVFATGETPHLFQLAALEGKRDVRTTYLTNSVLVLELDMMCTLNEQFLATLFKDKGNKRNKVTIFNGVLYIKRIMSHAVENISPGLEIDPNLPRIIKNGLDFKRNPYGPSN